MGINEYIQIGAKIKEARINTGITQKEMAEKLHLSVSSYSNYENGHREPSFEIIKQICEVLGFDVDELLGWNSNRTLKENLENSPMVAKAITDAIKKGYEGKIFQISFNTKDYSPQELLDILEYAEFLKSKRDAKPEE